MLSHGRNISGLDVTVQRTAKTARFVRGPAMDYAGPTKPPSHDQQSSRESGPTRALAPTQHLPATPVPAIVLEGQPETSARLLTFSRPAIENLYQQIGSPASSVLLTDRQGVILNSAGHPDVLDRAIRIALGPDTPELRVDTRANAILAALQRGAVVHVRSAKHELDHFIASVATPIFGPASGIIGFLAISTDARGDLAHVHALLRTTAELIEYRLIDSLDHRFLSVHFHASPALIGGPLEALAAFDENGELIASNRLARQLLALDPQNPVGKCDECFATPWSDLIERAGQHQNKSFPVRTVHGHAFQAHTTLRAARRPPPALAPP